jgi:hypothetical protein
MWLAATAQANSPGLYDFEGLRLSGLEGQDSWYGSSPQNQTVAVGSGVDATQVIGNGSGAGALSRINNASFSYQHFTGTETAAVSEMDLTLTSGPGTGGEWFALGHDVNGDGLLDASNELGPSFGVTSTSVVSYGFVIRAAGTNATFTVAPLGNDGTFDDWLRLKFVMNFVAGTGSLSYENLSRGQTSFTPVEGLQNINLALSTGPAPSTWDAMYIANNTYGQADNLIPNLAGVLGDFNRDGHVNAADIPVMEQALANSAAYEAQYHVTSAELQEIGNINGSGQFNNAQVQALINLLQSGGGNLASVPEPSSLILLLLGTGCVMGFCHQRLRQRQQPNEPGMCIPQSFHYASQSARPRWVGWQLNPTMTTRVSLLSGMILLVSLSSATAQTLSRGQQILQQRGLQIQAEVSPSPGINLATFAESNFTTVFVRQVDRTISLSNKLGPTPGIPSALQIEYGYLNSYETPFLPNLVGLQMSDEQDITNQVQLDAAKNLLADWRTMYPNTISYTNQSAGYSVAQLESYMSYVQPDMLMFDWYPFGGTTVGGEPSINIYNFMQIEREAALAGDDGTGQHPIPYGLYLQMSDVNFSSTLHNPSDSEMRLNQFAAWSFGYTYATAFTYLNTTLFATPNSDSSPTPAFYQLAEINLESRNMGTALVYLQSTDVRMVMGQHLSGSSHVTNTRPTDVSSWISGAGSDPYLTGVSATNLGTLNNGLRGDVIVSHFKPMQGASELYFMIVNGLTDPNGTGAQTEQDIHLTFNFGTSGITDLLEINNETGQVENVPLVQESGSLYQLDITLDGGTGALFKYDDGTAFVGGAIDAVPEPSSLALSMLCIACWWAGSWRRSKHFRGVDQ